MSRKRAEGLSREELRRSAERLYRHILRRHRNDRAIEGPDPGVRFNARVGRFIKSYLRFLPWSDDLIYVQAQKLCSSGAPGKLLPDGE